ncbi:hypothetical protein C9940_04145 [Pseudidiomarina aestuarii]|uniref:Uncharacterized protein n=1 Tax=Pseudidiomarina aestuarii TaxID=624146 RepID=A0A2T4CWU3_9GAMM|nr:hypothetical protein C9940_04145 [Pseudidiomarina aestuarii]
MRFSLLPLALLFLTACATLPTENELTHIRTHQAELDNVWPGYRVSERGFGIIDYQSRIILLGDVPEHPDFRKQENGLSVSTDTYPDLVSSYYIERDVLPNYRATLVNSSVSANTRMSFLFHEDFHGYQDEAFVGEMAATLAYADIGSMDIVNLLAAIQFEKALLTETIANLETDALEYLGLYIALRQWREKQLPQSFISTEQSIERKEGSALWLEAQVEEILSPPKTVSGSIIKKLNLSTGAINDDLSARLFSQRLYGTGAALLQVLDQFTERRSWQTELEDGSAPFTLVKEIMDLSPEEEHKLTKLVLESPEFERLKTRVRAQGIPTSTRQRVAAVVEDYPYTLELCVPLITDTPKEEFQMTFSFSNLITLPNGVLIPRVNRVELNTKLHRFVISNAPMFLFTEQIVDKSGNPHGCFQVLLENKPFELGDGSMIPTEIPIIGEYFNGTDPIEYTLFRSDERFGIIER